MPDLFLTAPNETEAVATAAATVAVLRDGAEGMEVLLVQRNRTGSFAGMWVFPGGRVDDGDGTGDEVEVARRAAAREAEEEAGLTVDPDDLVPLSWWLPPAEAARRFATWFFLVRSPDAPVQVDRTEVHDHRWVRPGAAQRARDRGELSLAPPTWMTLEWLAACPGVSGALALARSRAPERFVTRIVQSGDGALRATLWEGDVAYGDGDLGRPGPRRRLVADDGPWRYEGPEAEQAQG